MANYSTSADIIDAALFDCGEPSNGTSDYENQAVVFLNRGYQMIWMGGSEIDPSLKEEWPWLRAAQSGVITLVPPYTGSVTVTRGSTAIVFAIAPAASVSGWFFKADAVGDVFRITSHTAASTSATLDSMYTGPSSATEGYKVFKTDYDLPADVLRIISPMRSYRNTTYTVGSVESGQLEQRWPMAQASFGVPESYALIGDATVRFSHYWNSDRGDYLRLDFDYLQRPSDLTDDASSVPLLPFQYRHLLADYVSYRIMLAKNDNRADGMGLVFKAGVMAMARENHHRIQVGGNESGHISPRGDYWWWNLIPRTESGKIIG